MQTDRAKALPEIHTRLIARFSERDRREWLVRGWCADVWDALRGRGQRMTPDR